MGMAASQARLLSITTRMSDNELRSQIINNSKMRLASESSKVSERYIAALNETKYMMTNYDTKGKSQYQDLTFANLTAYSSYNNQYGLRNLSGQLLVSEETGFNYEQAIKNAKDNPETTDLEEFLKLYNLEKTTSYFDQLTAEQIDNALGMQNGAKSGISPQELKDMYLGENGHDGYDKIMSGAEYNTKYEPLFSDYNEKYAIYQEEMFDYVNDYNRNDLKLDELKTRANNTDDINALKGIYTDLINSINTGATKGIQNDTFFTEYNNGIISARDGLTQMATTRNGSTITLDGLFSFNTTTMAVTPIATDGSTFDPRASLNGNNYVVNQYVTDPDGNTQSIPHYIPKTNGNAYTVDTIDADTYKTSLINLISTYMEESPHHYDYSKFNLPANSDAAKARDAFNKAAQELSKYMFGAAVPPGDYLLLNDLEYILGKKDQLTDGTAGPANNNMKSILDVLICDAVFNEFGEPTVTWIDTTNPDEDATAKAQWYTNLFNRMRTYTGFEDEEGNKEYKNTYQVIENGLATSPDWIRYALESGLVTMEQVDKNFEWCSTMYNNCSDISETTDKTEATIAEAEYKSSMAKIQAKDKQYDIQLKNIDTEHNSLQTEYDSIKTVLDKNIERNFKMYSA